MKLIAGVDIGNSTTEVCIGSVGEDGSFQFRSSASRITTGTKGTLSNVHGIKAALEEAMDRIQMPLEKLDLVRFMRNPVSWMIWHMKRHRTQCSDRESV